jgi:hypothetical protein
MFDGFLVTLMILETYVLGVIMYFVSSDSGSTTGNQGAFLVMLRMLRLVRMARLGKLLKRLPELLILMKGIFVAMRSVLCTLALLFVVIYVFALIFRLLAKGTVMANEGFNSVPESMATLLIGGTLPDLEGIVMRTSRHHILYALLLLLFVLFSSLTLLNMLVGVLVEVVSVVSTSEKEHHEVMFVKDQLEKILASGIDADRDGNISKEEFCSLIENPVARRCLTNISVDVVGLVDITDFIFKGSESLTFPEFMEVLYSLRGSNKATVRDIVDLRKFVLQEFEALYDRICEVVDGGRGDDDWTDDGIRASVLLDAADPADVRRT